MYFSSYLRLLRGRRDSLPAAIHWGARFKPMAALLPVISLFPHLAEVGALYSVAVGLATRQLMTLLVRRIA
jgi:hypothetical protein